MIREFIIEALRLSCILTVIPLGAAALMGLCVAILQAVTQVQEQTTVYVAKLGGVALAILLLLHTIEDHFLTLMTTFGVILKSGGGDLTW